MCVCVCERVVLSTWRSVDGLPSLVVSFSILFHCFAMLLLLLLVACLILCHTVPVRNTATKNKCSQIAVTVCTSPHRMQAECTCSHVNLLVFFVVVVLFCMNIKLFIIFICCCHWYHFSCCCCCCCCTLSCDIFYLFIIFN